MGVALCYYFGYTRGLYDDEDPWDHVIKCFGASNRVEQSKFLMFHWWELICDGLCVLESAARMKRDKSLSMRCQSGTDGREFSA